ncbi:hypothetical protein BASA62_009161 [Batrachochytrium salamandrivorans]|nr:hypothetical protein BASA62_009161 [Batrachochytrium salamandrivorans]
MVAVSLVLVLALVSYTVTAQPKTKGLTSLFTCFKRQTTSKIPTKTVYEWIPLSEETPTPTSDEDPARIGLSYILQRLSLQSNKFKVVTSFTDHLKITHVYGVPFHEKLLIGNLHAAAHVKKGQVFFYSAIIKNNPRLTKRSPTTPESTVKISSEEAVSAAVDCLKVPFYPDIAPVMESYWTGDEDIPVWIVQLRDDPITRWFEVRVDARTGVVVSSQDFKRDFTYTAIKLPNKSPYDGFSTIVNPENIQSSPSGWTEGFELKGNNALIRFEGDMKFETTTQGVFNGGFDPILPPQTPKNLVTGAINAFYVIINVQSSKDTDNAYFLTPLDGRSGVLNLHIFADTNPNRDPALDNTMLTHELTHGLSERLTGGARTKMCIIKTESLGLSEGYSDMMALIFTAKPEDTRNTKRVIGEYVEGDSRGMRRYPYTTDMSVNPLKYKNAMQEKQRHRLGEIWASLLFEVYWNLVDAYGFSTNLHDATQKRGNIMFLQILVGTLMLQPCNPTFESARYAMLAADYAYYGGIHKHLINKGFAKRGLDPVSQSDPTTDMIGFWKQWLADVLQVVYQAVSIHIVGIPPGNRLVEVG